MQTHDSRGQVFPNHLVLNERGCVLTDTDIWATLEPANLHGPLYTSYFKEFASFYRAKESYTKDRIGYLTRSTNIAYKGERGGPVLLRPPQQFPKGSYLPVNLCCDCGCILRGNDFVQR